jgi:spore coat protein U-like protein
MQKERQPASLNAQFSASRLAAAVLLAFAGVATASAATLSVGPGKTYAKPCAAIAAAQDGDVIEITGNTTYSGDVCYINRNNLTIRGVNGRPKIDAAGKNAGGKGIWVVGGSNLTVDNVEMYGAKVPDANGAAFRLEATNFTLRNSFLHDNQNGILANANTNSDILIENTEFGHNGAGDGQSHNLYIGHVKSLTFRYNFSHDANVGHNLKSRANTNMIAYNRFSSLNPGETGSTAAGKPSYEIDLPNAGTSYLIGNIIQQPASNSNPSMLAYGEEGATNIGSDLYVINNTFLNDMGSGGTFMFISGNVPTPAVVQNNIFGGVGTFSTQSSTIDKTNYRSASPSFVNRAAYDLHPTGALMIDTGSDPGKSAAGVSLAPVAQYKAVASGEARPVVGQLDIGAYEATSAGTTSGTTTWTACATEGGTCSFSGTREVRFGANGVYTSKVITSSTPCTTAVFGDPIRGVVKSCSYASTTTTTTAPATAAPTTATPTFTACASEGGTCSFSGKREVRYGTATIYTSKVLTGPVVCSNTVFGDPARGQVKSCSYSSVTQ